MVIYSWNMLFRNRELDRAFNFIRDSDFDIFCLQEVPDDFLTRLQTLPCNIAYHIDVERHLLGATITNFLVILSKHPIEAEARVPFPDYGPLLSLRTRAFLRIMRPLHFAEVFNRGGMYADIRIQNKAVPVRVLNLHLILARPAWRLKEFEAAIAERDPGVPAIVCGDFNVIESPRVSLLNWLFGGPATDTLLYERERTAIEKRFVEHSLHNPLRGRSTHAFAGSQLDHILVSHSFSIKSAEVLPHRYGSDHHPIRVKLA